MMKRQRLLATWGLLLAWVCSPLNVVVAAEPLREEIDQRIEQQSFGAGAPIADDAEYLRRVTLHLTGSIPTSDTARAFLDDPSPGKREALVDRLLASPQYVRHLSAVLDVMLMERRPEQHVKHEEWRKYLFDSVAQNKPWNQLAREILGADGSDERIRAAAAFYLSRGGEAHLLTRDVGRIFFGVDLQCAQCHNHPLIDTYHQTDYYGLYAFLSRSLLFTDKENKVFLAEKAEGDVSFKSVFTSEQGQTLPRLPAGFEIDEPFFWKGEEYEVAPADGVRPIPKYSRRSKLAESASDGSNPQFNRNIVNRLWAYLMGRGLVEPVDLHHAGNPPAHPDLLDLLAKRFAEMGFDMKAFLRELTLTRAYQRALEAPPPPADQTPDLSSRLAASEQVLSELKGNLQKVREDLAALEVECSEAKAKADPLLNELTKSNDASGEARKAADAAASALADAQQQEQAKRTVADALVDAATTTGQAAQMLAGDDEELAQVAATLRTRAEKAAEELEAAVKVVAEKLPAVQASAEALQAARETVEQIKSQFDAARAQSRELQPRLLAARQERDRLVQQEQLLRKGLAVGRSVLERQQRAEAFATQESLLNQTSQSLADCCSRLNAARGDLSQLQQTMVTAEQGHTDAVRVLSEAQKRLTVTQAAAELLAAAARSSEAAAHALPDDAELNAIVQSLRGNGERLNAELAGQRAAAPQLEQTASAAATKLAEIRHAVEQQRAEIKHLEAAEGEMQARLRALEAGSESARLGLQAAQDKLADLCERQFFARSLQHLTPEQMAWSIMQATGVLENTRAATLPEIEMAVPLDPENPEDPARLADRERQLERAVYDKLQGNVAPFIRLFGHGGGQPQADFFATVDQALFFANGGTLLSWLEPSGNNLTARLNQIGEPGAIAEELYLSVLTRRPTEEETAEVAQYLMARPEDKLGSLKQMAWALITSAEFRFNH